MRKDRIIALVLCLLLLVPSSGGSAEAPTTSATSTLTIILSVDEDVVNVSAVCRVPSPQTAVVTVYLQQNIGGTWLTVDSGNTHASKATARCEWTDGATWRGYAQCMIYDSEGRLIESFGKYSSVKPE